MTAAAQDAADAAVAVDGIASAAIFLTNPAGPDGGLSLGGAAGISGPPLDGLIAAVTNPAHPIRRSVSDPAREPDLIFLYRAPILLEWVETGEDLFALVRNVVVHEIAHHFGFSDAEIEAIEQELE